MVTRCNRLAKNKLYSVTTNTNSQSQHPAGNLVNRLQLRPDCLADFAGMAFPSILSSNIGSERKDGSPPLYPRWLPSFFLAPVAKTLLILLAPNLLHPFYRVFNL